MRAAKKAACLFMSIVLVMGLMPLPAFAAMQAGEIAEPQEEAAEPESSPLQDAADTAGSALSALGASVTGAISALGGVQDDPVVLDSGTCGENLTWEYWDDARLVISGTGEMGDYSIGTQPWSSWLTVIQSVEVGDGVASVGDYAFYRCSQLHDVSLPNSTVRIGSYAFAYDLALDAIALPDGVGELGSSIFDHSTALKTCHLPANVKYVPDSLFHFCYGLTDVDMPTAPLSIGAKAFYFCNSLPKIEIPETVEVIGESAFMTHSRIDNPRIVIPGSVRSIGDWAFCPACDYEVIIEEGNLEALPNAFDLYSVEYGDTSTFYTSSIMAITIPKTVKSVDPYIRAQSIVLDSENPNLKLVDGVLFARSPDAEVDEWDVLNLCPKGKQGSYTIPEGVKEVSDGAFRFCSELTELNISSSVKSIKGDYGVLRYMDNCRAINVDSGNSVYASLDGVLYNKSMTSLLRCPCAYGDTYVFPDTVTDFATFDQCRRLTDVVFNSNVTTLGFTVFSGSTSVVNVYIPKSVTTIRSGVADVYRNKYGEQGQPKCYYYEGSEEDWAAINDGAGVDSGSATVYFNVKGFGTSGDIAYMLDDDETLSVFVKRKAWCAPSGVMSDFQVGAAPWSGAAGRAKKLEVDNGVEEIGSYAFAGFKTLTDVSLPSSLVRIGEGSFSDCVNLRDVKTAGLPFEVSAANAENPSFDNELVTVSYLESVAEQWQRDAGFSVESNTWNGYCVSEIALPVLSRVTFGSDAIRVVGWDMGMGNIQMNPVRVYDQDGADISDKVAVRVEPPEHVRQRTSSGDSGQVEYSEQAHAVRILNCAPAGECVVTVEPIEGLTAGAAIKASFSIERDPERFYCGGTSPTSVTVYGRGSSKRHVYLLIQNQFQEVISEDECVFRIFDKQTGSDVTDKAHELGVLAEETGLYVDPFAIARSYEVTISSRDGSISGSQTYDFSVERYAGYIDAPVSMKLWGGDALITVDGNDSWSSLPYRAKIIDGFNDPVWPSLDWTFYDSDDSDVSQYFSVDEQGYLLVKRDVAEIMDQNGGELPIRVHLTASVNASAQTASGDSTVRLKLAPELMKPATHTATFKAGDEVVGEVVFAEGDGSLEEPSVPQRENYIGAWEEYDLASATGDITVNAVYSPIDPDAVSEVSGEAEATYDKSVVTVNLAAAAATRQVKVESESTKPVDVVMVLDQSGSMAEKLGASQTKRDALVECANSFAQQLYANAEKTGADHRVALVGFAYSAYNNGKYKNTGLLAGAAGAKGFAQLSKADYAGALLPVKGDGGVNEAVTAGIDSIVADGATAADVGLKIAKNVFSENPIATGQDGTPERERIVVFITDGVPTSWGLKSSLVRETAAEAILMARDVKQGQGARIYSVGVDADANPAAAFNAAADGVVTGARDAFKSYDFNRFLHAVSSNYPEASGMADLGEGANDAGYYMAVNDTSSLGKIFRNILYSTVYSIETFDRATLAYTLPDGFVLTMRQEEEMRAALAEQGLTDDDIVVAADPDGKTTITFRNVKVAPETIDGVVKYVARVSFQVTADNGVSGSVAAGSAAVEQNGETVAVEVPTVEVPDERCLVVFKVNDAVYEIREAAIGDEIELPDTNLARWLQLEKMREQGTAQVSEAYAVFETSTLTRAYNVSWTVGENSLTTSYQPGAAVTVPDEVLAWVPDGFELAGWAPALPATMPARNISATAVLTPEHKHDHSFSTYRTGSCEDGIVTHHVCACGDETTEHAAPKGHAYDAVLSSNGVYDLAVEKLVCRDCGQSVDKSLTYKFTPSSFWDMTVADLTMYESEVAKPGASDEDISLRFYVGEGANNRSYWVTRIDADGKKTSYVTRIVDGYLTFDPDHFSIYAFGESEQGAEALSYEDALAVLENPELPDVEGDPEGNADVSEPDDPIEPADPTDPTDPTDPADPVDPVEPTEPDDPIDPTEPTDPTDPADPVDPAKPADPVDPVGPAASADSSKSTGPIDLSGATVVAADQVYTGAKLEPAVTVILGGKIIPANGYSVEYDRNVDAGTATVSVSGAGGKYRGVAVGTFTIAPASQTVRAVKASYKVKAKAVKKKAKKISVKFKASGGGKVTYKAAKKGKVSIAKNGKVTVRKGAKKGAYKLKVTCTAAPTGNYAQTVVKNVPLVVKVK